MIRKKPITPEIHPEDIPHILSDFFDLATTSNFPIKHRYFAACKYFHKLQKGKASSDKVPLKVKILLSEIYEILIMSEKLRTTNKWKELSRVKDITTIFAESQVGSYYRRRGYKVKWLSPESKDPPDLIVTDPDIKLCVDIEVKIKDDSLKVKDFNSAVKAVFNSLSKSLKSLNNRKAEERPAVVAIHADKDLDWNVWLTNHEVFRRLKSRFDRDEYKCISGIIFSGGNDIYEIEKGVKAIDTKLVSFISHRADYPLPKGFLPSISGEL
jgi:hypothetical protein